MARVRFGVVGVGFGLVCVVFGLMLNRLGFARVWFGLTLVWFGQRAGVCPPAPTPPSGHADRLLGLASFWLFQDGLLLRLL